jgi:sulfur-oxidizing protein SoxZ
MADAIKMRVTLDGDVADIRVKMTHPMETGTRVDQKTKEKVPAHFINQVTATLNGKPVMEAQWGSSVSKDPFLGFKVKGAKAGDKLAINAVDNQGTKFSSEETVAAK